MLQKSINPEKMSKWLVEFEELAGRSAIVALAFHHYGKNEITLIEALLKSVSMLCDYVDHIETTIGYGSTFTEKKN